MKYGGLIISNEEYDTLIHIIGMSQNRKDETYLSSIAKLLAELKLAQRKDVAEIPEDVVRFNSFVTVELPDGRCRDFQIVAPDKSDVATNKISILAPMGLALFGYAAGDKLLWQFPSGMQSIKIIKVAQMKAEPKTVYDE